VPLVEAVAVHVVAPHLDANKVFTPNESQVHAAKVTYDELLRWANALAPLRAA